MSDTLGCPDVSQCAVLLLGNQQNEAINEGSPFEVGKALGCTACTGQSILKESSVAEAPPIAAPADIDGAFTDSCPGLAAKRQQRMQHLGRFAFGTGPQTAK